MASLLRHEKENQFSKLVFSILNDYYDGNILKYKEAEKDARDFIKLNKNLKKVTVLSSNLKNIKDPYIKYTHVDLKNKIVSMVFTESPYPLLGYNIDYLKSRRYFPFGFDVLFERNKTKDLRKLKNTNNIDKKQEAKYVFDWVKNRVLNNYFSVNNVRIDKSSGRVEFSSSFRDLNYGMTLQNIVAKIPNDKHINISGLKGTPLKLSKDYNTLFLYFSMLGFTEFYARCTCPEFMRKHSRKDVISNYFCSHLLYSIMQFPYYVMYVMQ